MLTRDEATTRVARGAAHLDQVRPGWFQEIDTGKLSLSSCSQCVLGQLFDGNFWDGARAFWATTQGHSRSRTSPEVMYGFAVCNDDYLDPEAGNYDERVRSSYGPLQDAWIEVIADRQLAAAQAHREPASTNAVRLSVEQPFVPLRV